MTADQHTPISADSYDRAYFLEHMDGADEFVYTQGQTVAPRLHYALQLAHVQPGQRVLDIGCGRGEATWRCAERRGRAHGLDFSWDALQISRQLALRAKEQGLQIELEQASAYHLPFANDSFDTALMFDIAEHLYAEELLATFAQVRRVLKQRGRLIVHTMPNADYYRWGYPVYRALMRLLGHKLPRDPRQRWYRGETHVNVQTPRSLRKALQAAGFVSVKVWLRPLGGSALSRLLLSLYPIRWILCNDILAVAAKS